MKDLKELIGKPILDVPCKFCESYNTHQYDVDEKDFACDGTGHYYVDYFCQDCGCHFRVYFYFKYELTGASY